MKKKVCLKCRKEKPISDFSKRSASKDGLEYRCKDCRNLANRKYFQTDNGRASSARYRQSAKGKATLKEYYAATIEQHKAQRVINHMVEDNTMPNVSTNKCQCCGKTAQEYHHPDYSQPKAVTPLCRRCHKKEHA